MTDEARRSGPGLWPKLRSGVAFAWAFFSLWVFVPVALLFLPIDRRQRLHDLFATWWARGALSLAGIRVRSRGTEILEGDEHFVLVSNHQSLMDPLLLVAALQSTTPIRFVAKRQAFQVPVLGWGMHLFGHMPVDQRDARRSLPGIRQAEVRVRERWSVAFFSEGTRTRDGTVGRFKSSAFRVAQRAEVRIVPVSISGAFTAMPRDQWAAIPGSEVVITVHAPVDPPGNTPEEMNAVVGACAATIAAAVAVTGPEGAGSAF